MLGEHPEIGAVGEADFLFDHLYRDLSNSGWASDIARLQSDRLFQSKRLRFASKHDGRAITVSFVDQLRLSSRGLLGFAIHRNINKVAALFPESKIIHIVRDPRDVAASCVRMGWAGNTYFGIDSWIDTEINWNKTLPVLPNCNICEVRFATLVSRPRAELERVCDFLGVTYSTRMLEYNLTSTYDPPDPNAIERWRKSLGPREVELVEIKAGTLMLQRGYELSKPHLTPPTSIERIRLWCANRAWKWKFAINRYGFLLFLFEKITRKLVKAFHPVVQMKINEIDVTYLR